MSGLGELDRPGAPTGAAPDRTGSGNPESAFDSTGSGNPESAFDSTGSGNRESAVDRTRPGKPESGVDRAASPPRQGAADPVKALMHRHRELCERAVDPLEIAAGLEAHGITDRTAARFRHRDVFSLAEELYARVPRDTDTATGSPAAPTAPAGEGGGRRSLTVLLLPLLPGALCAAALVALARTHGQTRLYAAAAGVLTVALALRAAVRRGPLARPGGLPPRSATGSSWWESSG